MIWYMRVHAVAKEPVAYIRQEKEEKYNFDHISIA